MLPPPDGVWGMPPEDAGEGARLRSGRRRKPREGRARSWKARLRARQALKVKVSTRNIPIYRDPAVILIDQLKEIYIDARTRVGRHQQLVRQGRAQGLHGRPEPDRQRRRRSRCAVLRELLLRVGAQLHRLLQPGDREAVRQAVDETDAEKRKKLVWEIDTKLQEDVARPIIFHGKLATCWHPHVKGFIDDDEQPLQRLALRRRLARQVVGVTGGCRRSDRGRRRRPLR